MATHDIIVLGASAGGVETLKKLVQGLSAEIPASLFVVMHQSIQSPNHLPRILEKVGKLPALIPADREEIRRGTIYVAPADYHMLLEPERVRIVHGPKENRHRPAVDPLFRSAAWAFGPRVIGVILSGMLDDGSAGLWAVKSSGGIAVVQEPGDALYPGMPALLGRLARKRAGKARKSPDADRLKLETEFAALNGDIHDMIKLGKPASFTCPACGGSLWELMEGDLWRYRCHVGHAYASESLVASQGEQVESALFTALRSLEEKGVALRRLAERFSNKNESMASKFEEQAKDSDRQADLIRNLLANRSLN